jgi:hypothetical protein
VGSLINDETRRLATSAFLGARCCWEKYHNKKPEDMTFKVAWIGFWFNIPGTTLDPAKVAGDFYKNDFDVVMSGIATPFERGRALSAQNAAYLDRFIAGLGDRSIQPFKGSLQFQDGTVFLKEGEVATPQKIWYLPQLLKGMEGKSK